MAKVWKRRDRDIWVADFRDASGRRVRKTAPSRQEAEDLLAELKVEANKQVHLSAEDRDVTFADYATRWQADIACDLESKTQKSYQHLLEQHIVPILGRFKLREIRRSHIKTLLSSKRDDGYAKNTVRLIRA